jgi:hypothetical protein
MAFVFLTCAFAVWAPAGCNGGTAPTPVAEPLAIARSIAAQDPRISKLLAPATPNDPNARGFDARLASPGLRTRDRTAVGMQMPAFAHEAIRVGLGNTTASQIVLTPKPGGRADVRAEIRDGVAFYRDAYESTDMLAASGRSLSEVLYLLKSPDAPKQFAWHIQLPAGVEKVESRNDGVWFLDRNDTLVLRVPEPYAVDAKGVKQAALLTWNEPAQELSVELTSDAGLTYPILLDPAFESEVWVQVQTPPPSAEHKLVYDPDRKRVVAFGGDLPRNETWLYDGLTWSKRVKGRAGVNPGTLAAVWDSSAHRVLAVAVDGATASWDGVSWQAEASLPFSQRFITSIADVPGKGVFVFGGWDATSAIAGSAPAGIGSS